MNYLLGFVRLKKKTMLNAVDGNPKETSVHIGIIKKTKHKNRENPTLVENINKYMSGIMYQRKEHAKIQS